jgi:hypothetical protein
MAASTEVKVLPNIDEELRCVQDLADLTRMSITNIRDAKSLFGPSENGIDVIFEYRGKRMGAQHTIFHSDEGQTLGKRGSQARAKEEATSRTTRRPFPMWFNPDYSPALTYRFDEKIKIAARHDTRHLAAENWLVISANLNKWGAVGSTIIVPTLLRIEELNRLYHFNLTVSKFDRAYLILHIDNIVYGWNQAERWRLVADPHTREREQHLRQMNDLVFNRIARNRRG